MKIIKRSLPPVIVFLLVIGAWDLFTVRLGIIDERFLPSPWVVFGDGIELLLTPTLWTVHLAVTLQEMAIGSLFAITAGVIIGMIIGRWNLVSQAIEPYVIALYAMPRVALIPLMILFLGIGLQQKVAMVFLGAFFPMCITTIAGARAIDPVLIRVGRSFGVNRWQELWHVVLPASLPFVFAGARLSLVHAFLTAVVTEMYASRAGIGFLIAYLGNLYKVGPLLMMIVLTMIIGVILSEGLQRLEKKIIRYR